MSAAVEGISKSLGISVDNAGNRRSACDRCRSHKLRCERSPQTPDCRRCIKANSRCVTGAALKSGRPLQFHTPNSQDSERRATSQEHIDVDMVQQESIPSFPTPPSNCFEGDFGGLPISDDGNLGLSRLASPTVFNGFLDIFSSSVANSTTTHFPTNDITNSETDNLHPERLSLHQSDPRADSLRKISILQASVLTDLSIVSSCRTADKCALPENSNPAEPGHNFLVGRMLDHSTKLIEILKCFEPTPDTDSALLWPRAIPFCDIPTMCMLLSCYVCIIRIHRTIFSCIHDSVPFLVRLQEPVPQLFPGMHLGGFKLEQRVDLQIQILIQVSEDLLEKIEKRIGITDNDSASGASIFQNTNARKLLQIMLIEESHEQPQLHENRGHCKPLREILKDLKDLVEREFHRPDR